jgi:hypothetical protein
MAEPERGHSEAGALPSGGLAARGGSATESFVSKVLAGQINQMKTYSRGGWLGEN